MKRSLIVNYVVLSLMLGGTYVDSATSLAQTGVSSVATGILQEISEIGAQKFVQERLPPYREQELLQGVKQGDREFLRVANALLPASDGAFSEDLIGALASALALNPGAVLEEVKNLESAPWSIRMLCESVPVDDGDREQIRQNILRLEERISALSVIAPKITTAAECIRAAQSVLLAQKKELAQS